MSCNESLLNREYSTWTKGLLTLFIILGHNMVFTLPLSDYGVMSYFYIFHIQGFFILPFLYGTDTKRDWVVSLKNSVIRLYWPYFWLVSGMALVYGSIHLFSGITGKSIMQLYLFCNSSVIKQMCGVQIFWFLPSMMICMLLKEFCYRSGVFVRSIVFSISILYSLCAIFANTSYPLRATFNNITSCIPLGGGYAIQMLALGVLLRLIVAYIHRKRCYLWAFLFSITGFFICSLLYIKYVSMTISLSDLNVMYVILQNTAPLFFMISLVSALALFQPQFSGSVVCKIGSRSLYIYLISPFVGYLFFYLCDYFDVLYWWFGLLLLPLITALSYALSLLIKGKIERILFPSGLSEWKRLFGM